MAKTSFLPEDYVERKAQRRTNIISLTLFVVVMTSIIAAFLVTDRQRAEMYSLQDQVNSQFEEAAKRLEQLDDLQRRKEKMLRKARVTAMLIERAPRSLILAELINQMPSALSLLELELKSKVVSNRVVVATALDKAKLRSRKAQKGNQQEDAMEPEARKMDVAVRLVGVAPTDVQVAQFMTSLSRSLMFADVNLAFSEEVNLSENRLMRKFRIDLKLNQEADIQKLGPTRIDRTLNKNPMADTIHMDGAGRLVMPAGKGEIVPVDDRSPGPADEE